MLLFYCEKGEFCVVNKPKYYIFSDDINDDDDDQGGQKYEGSNSSGVCVLV